ncbi:hypothetical protein [Streptomyces sp. NPDC102437]|uniref:hypothetical protein n=1 Tax=Streptomyces sp. NPDC102437 TaxID=3366175 RepID=UPI0037F28F5E
MPARECYVMNPAYVNFSCMGVSTAVRCCSLPQLDDEDCPMTAVATETTDAMFDAIATIVEKDGFFLWKVQGLKMITGDKRAGARKVERMEKELADRGILHLPRQIPRDEKAKVLFYAPNGGKGLGTLIRHLVGANDIYLSNEDLELVGAILGKHRDAVRTVEATES